MADFARRSAEEKIGRVRSLAAAAQRQAAVSGNAELVAFAKQIMSEITDGTARREPMSPLAAPNVDS